MKEIMVANVFLDGRIGGPPRRVVSIAKRIEESGFKTLLVFPYMGEGLLNFIKENKMEFSCFSLSRIRMENPIYHLIKYLILLPFEGVRLSFLFRKKNVALVHANGILNIQALIGGKLAGIPVLWHLNDVNFPSWFCRFYRFFWGWLACQRLYTGKRARQHYGDNPNGPLDLLYPPVNRKKFHSFDVPQMDKPFQKKNDEILLLSIGNVNPVKGFQFLIPALGTLRDTGIKWRLIILGAILDTNKKFYLELLDKIKEEKIEDQIEFPGISDKIPEALNLCDIFIMSSLLESGPMVVLEALSVGKPVIATDVGIVKECIEDGVNGLIVPPRDVSLMANAIKTLLNDKELRKKLSKNACSSVDEKFTEEKVAEKTLSIYKRFVHG